MKSCLFCRNTRIFNIHNDYGNNNHTAKDDMIQFFGYQIESHLLPGDAICNLCMNIMENVAKLKRRLLPLIFRTDPTYIGDRKPINFGKKWDIFASISFDDEDPFLDSPNPSPDNLVMCKRVVPYEIPLEIKIAEKERQRTLSRLSVAKSEAESEIVQAFSKRTGRKRKRGHNWSRRKIGRYSSTDKDYRKSVASTYSRRSTRSRPVSSLSIMSTESYESFYPPTSYAGDSSPVTTASTGKSNLKYLLQNKRTRSVSKQLEEEVNTMVFREDDLHQCSEEGCTFICEDIDLMATHKQNKHRQLALFRCNICGKKYTSSGDLEIHNRLLHSEPYACAICRREFCYDKDLIEHWQEHVKKSVACKYCGKRFVDKNVLKKHQKNVHRRNIPSRIEYEKNFACSNKPSTDYEVRILLQKNSNEDD